MLAQAIGCNLTDKVDAIINIEGMQALGMSCTPRKTYYNGYLWRKK